MLCWSYDKPKKTIRATSFNVSLGGIGIDLKKFIEGDRRIKLQIFKLPIKPPIEVEGNIVWQGYLSNVGKKRASIQFTKIPWSKAKVLLQTFPG